MRSPLSLLLLITQLPYPVSTQIAEIASLVTGIVAPQLISGAGAGAAGAASAASAATGALGGIGSLYQLAQGALQLTGTGVGILNQASEGKWFSMVAENVVNSQRELQDKLLTAGARPDQLSLLGTSNGAVGLVGRGAFPPAGLETEFSRLGTNFPAPRPEDYDTNEASATTQEQSLIAISHTDPPTTTEAPITLFPEEKLEKKGEEFDISQKKHTNNLHSGPWRRTDEEYYDDVRKEFNKDEYYQDISDEHPPTSTAHANTTGQAAGLLSEVEGNGEKNEKAVPKLARLVELLRESNLSDDDLKELVHQLQENRHPGKPVVPVDSERHFALGGQRLSFIKFDMKRHPLAASARSKVDRSELSNATEDSDLLKRPHHIHKMRTSTVTINTETVKKRVSAPRAEVPTSDEKNTHVEQTRSLAHAHTIPSRRAFAVSSQQRRISPKETAARLYRRRTVASRPTTPAPVVDKSTTTLTSANSQSHNTNNPSHPHATQVATVQKQTSLHNNGNRSSIGDGSAWLTAANGNTHSQQQWPTFGGNIGSSPQAFSGSDSATPTSPWMHILPVSVPQFQPAHIQSQSFISTQTPLFSTPPFVQPLPVYKPLQTFNFPFALNPPTGYSTPWSSQSYPYPAG